MMRRQIAVFIGSASLTLAACGVSAFPEPGAPEVQQAGVRWPGTNLAELKEGRSLYLGRCGSCHRPFEPGEVDSGDWQREIAEMQAQAKLSDAQAELIAKYIITISEQASL